MNMNGGSKKAAPGISYPVEGSNMNMATKNREITAPLARANFACALPSRAKAQVRPMAPKPAMSNPKSYSMAML